MMSQNYLKPVRLSLKGHPHLNEKWVQELIADDPSILGLGDLELRGVERRQPRAGRLDLLLQDSDSQRRYEVEIQLGSTDESHIIRTIEYWDIEKKRYPQYDHCAVLVAEDVTSRFLNVLSLFNGTMPFIAIQMQALQVGDNVTLVFTKVMDEFSRGLVDEDEEAEAVPTDRAYWEQRATTGTVALADRLLALLHKFDPTLTLKYNKNHIGLARNGQAFNFVSFGPRKNYIIFLIRLPQADELDRKINEAGLNPEYSKGRRYRLRLTEEDVKSKSEILEELSRLAYERRIEGEGYDFMKAEV